MITTLISELEHEQWTPEIGTDINPESPDGYNIVKTPAGLCLHMCSFKPYGGWLAKQISPFPCDYEYVQFRYRLMIDDSTLVCAQVIETDAKITALDGTTYDFSAQWNIAKEWMLEIDNTHWTWTETGITIPALVPFREYDFVFNYQFHYSTKTSAITSVVFDEDTDNEMSFTIPENLQGIPGKQVGWDKSQVVTQLQQCNNANPGAYMIRFKNIGYILSNQEE